MAQSNSVRSARLGRAADRRGGGDADRPGHQVVVAGFRRWSPPSRCRWWCWSWSSAPSTSRARTTRRSFRKPEAGHDGSGIDQSVLSLLTGAHSSHYGWYGVLAGASIVFFAFIGFDIVATMAEETKNPQRDVPRGILASLAIVTVLYVAVSVVLSGMVSYTQLKTVPGRKPANLATAFAANGIHWASRDHLHRGAGRADHRGDGADARAVPGAVRDGARRVVAAAAGQDRFARHPGPDHRAGCGGGGRDGLGVPDRQARGDGQRRNAVRVRPGVGRRHRPAPDPPGPASGASARPGCRCFRSPRYARVCG